MKVCSLYSFGTIFTTTILSAILKYMKCVDVEVKDLLRSYCSDHFICDYLESANSETRYENIEKDLHLSNE